MTLTYTETAKPSETTALCLRALGVTATLPGLELSLANPDRVRLLGCVKKAETLDYSRGTPVPQGLFDPAIFGPFDDASHVATGERDHEGRGATARSSPELAQEIDPGTCPAGQLRLALPLVHPLVATRCVDFVAETAKMSLEATTAALQFDDLEHRLALLRGLEASPVGRALIIKELPILPTGLRRMVALGNGRWGSLGVNELYRALLNRNTRLARLLDLNAPEVALNNEARMVHEAMLTLMTGEQRERDELDDVDQLDQPAPEKPTTVPLCELVPGGLDAALATLDLSTPTRKKTFLVVSVLWALGFEAHPA